ncbi:MAG: hypothetical protein QNK37_11395 [Acidobacteriota bacterium]|nr:hypothetical protein [Acidobacteriota bacterium]
MIITGTRNLQVLRGLTGNRSVLSCKADGSIVDLWSEDDGSGRQQWEFKPLEKDIYNILVNRGLSSNRKYLSCNSDGTVVDLWNCDDGSGRQRWKLSTAFGAPTPDTFHLFPENGVSGSRKYLSCTSDGTKVDLWNKDDASGRQRWQIQKQIDHPTGEIDPTLAVVEALPKDKTVRAALYADPVKYLREKGISIEKKYEDSVNQSVKSLVYGDGVKPDLTVPEYMNSISQIEDAQKYLQEQQERRSMSAENQQSELSLEFSANGWGLVLSVPREDIDRIANGQINLAQGSLAIAGGLAGLAGMTAKFPPLSTILGIAAVLAGGIAATLFANVGLMYLFASEKGVYLTWTYIALLYYWFIPFYGPM